MGKPFFNLVGPIRHLSAEKRTKRSIVPGLMVIINISHRKQTKAELEIPITLFAHAVCRIACIHNIMYLLRYVASMVSLRWKQAWKIMKIDIEKILIVCNKYFSGVSNTDQGTWLYIKQIIFSNEEFSSHILMERLKNLIDLSGNQAHNPRISTLILNRLSY